MSDVVASCIGESRSIALAPEIRRNGAPIGCVSYHPRDLNIVPPPSGRTTLKARRAGTPKKSVDAQTVLRSFNTWAFKREQPADLPLMLRAISQSIALREPISFVLYWGKGPRCRIGEPDIACLDFLAGMAHRVREAYPPGAAIKLIFTDTHAQLNGHAPTDIRAYFTALEACAGERGFATCLLGPLTRSARSISTGAPDDEVVPEETLARLSACAEKWYRGEGTAGQGALKYYQMNMQEKRAVERAFPGSIFVTFNGSELRSLFPDRLPVFHMYSLRRGVSIKPWFLPAAAAVDGHCEGVDLP
jgi:hypothetical protein